MSKNTEPDLSFIYSDINPSEVKIFRALMKANEIQAFQVTPVNSRRLAVLVNCYLKRIMNIMNSYANKFESALLEAEHDLAQLETKMQILEAKVKNYSGLLTEVLVIIFDKDLSLREFFRLHTCILFNESPSEEFLNLTQEHMLKKHYLKKTQVLKILLRVGVEPGRQILVSKCVSRCACYCKSIITLSCAIPLLIHPSFHLSDLSLFQVYLFKMSYSSSVKFKKPQFKEKEILWGQLYLEIKCTCKIIELFDFNFNFQLKNISPEETAEFLKTLESSKAKLDDIKHV